MKPLRVFAEAFLILAGAILIFIPDGRHFCIRCAPLLFLLVGIISIVLGAVTLANEMAKAPSAGVAAH